MTLSSGVVSDSERDPLQILCAPPTRYELLSPFARAGRAQRRIAALHALLPDAAPSLVFALLRLLREEGELGREIGRAIETLATRMSPTQLDQVGSQLRQTFPGRHDSGSAWVLSHEAVPDLARRFRETPAVIGLVACHPNGYVREAAVRALVALGDPRTLRYLVLRLNDWVEQVAEPARAGALALLTPERRREVCLALPFLIPLGGRSRRDHRAVIAAAAEVLRSDGGRTFVELCPQLDRVSRRHGFAWLFAGDVPPDGPALRAALAEPEPGIQRFALRALERDIANPATRELVLERADHATSPRVRAEALRILARGGLAREERLTAALLDPGVSVRNAARELVREHLPGLDLAAFYREQLVDAHPRRLAAAIDGLRQYGSPSDSARLVPLLGHASARVRATALSALGDDSRPVRRVARRVLRELREHLDGATLRERARTLGLGQRRELLSLAAVLPKWERLQFLLQELLEPQPELRADALIGLRGWRGGFNRSFAQPSPRQAVELRALFDATAELLPRETADFLRHVLPAR